MGRRRAVAGSILACSLAAWGMGCGRYTHDPSSRESAETYAPGLGEIMASTQMRHLKLWYAGAGRNWPLAAYEVDELEEGFADVVHFHPELERSRIPLRELVPEFTAKPIQQLRKAIAAQSEADFVAAYDALSAGCNACHGAARFSFNVIVRPSLNPYSNQRFEGSR